MKSIYNIPEINARAENILKHKCDKRCKMRIGPGNSEKYFQCRKLHAIRDIPDPTLHCYIPIKYQFQKTPLEVLEDMVCISLLQTKMKIYLAEHLLINILLQDDTYLPAIIMQNVICLW